MSEENLSKNSGVDNGQAGDVALDLRSPLTSENRLTTDEHPSGNTTVDHHLSEAKDRLDTPFYSDAKTQATSLESIAHSLIALTQHLASTANPESKSPETLITETLLQEPQRLSGNALVGIYNTSPNPYLRELAQAELKNRESQSFQARNAEGNRYAKFQNFDTSSATNLMQERVDTTFENPEEKVSLETLGFKPLPETTRVESIDFSKPENTPFKTYTFTRDELMDLFHLAKSGMGFDDAINTFLSRKEARS